MTILSIDTSCDETAAAVTEGTKILSNIIWSQASAHAKFGGVMPSLAQRMHEERIGFVIDKALGKQFKGLKGIEAIAVTIGPGLSIALGVGVNKAKELAKKYNKKLIAVNHLEGHLLSSFAEPRISSFQLPVSNELSILKFPSLGLVVSGKNTILIKANEIGKYETLATTVDDALGEALDKAARMLGLGYPGGYLMERFAKLGNSEKYMLPVPLAGQEDRHIFSYSGLKTSMMRLVEKEKPLTKEKIYDLTFAFQDTAFKHLIRVISHVARNSNDKFSDFLVGGGVAANVELKNRLRKLGKEFGISVHFPYSKKLYGDNAAMVGVAAGFKAQREEFANPDIIDRDPNLKIDK